MKKVYEVRFEAPVARLAVRNDVVLGAFQKAREYQSERSTYRIAPGVVGRLDPRTLELKSEVECTGEIRSLHLNAKGTKAAFCSFDLDPGQRSHNVHTLDLDSFDLSSTSFAKAYDCAWWRDHLVVSLFDRAFGEDHGNKCEVRSTDLERCLHVLHVRDAGFNVAAEGDVVASGGIDVHLWWPERGESFSFHEQCKEIRIEMGSPTFSSDGQRIAFMHDNRLEKIPQVYIASVDSPRETLMGISDGTRDSCTAVTFSPKAHRIAVHSAARGLVHVFDSDTGSLVTTVDSPGSRAVAWLDDTTVLIGGETLSAYRVQ